MNKDNNLETSKNNISKSLNDDYSLTKNIDINNKNILNNYLLDINNDEINNYSNNYYLKNRFQSHYQKSNDLINQESYQKPADKEKNYFKTKDFDIEKEFKKYLCNVEGTLISISKLQKDDYNIHILNNRFNIILKKILTSNMFLNIKRNDYCSTTINYIDYLYYNTQEVRYNFSYIVFQNCSNTNEHIVNYSEFLNKALYINSIPAIAIIKKLFNYTIVEYPQELIEIKNNNFDSNSIKNINIIILLILSTISRGGYYISNFRIFISRFLNPSDITINYGDIRFELKEVSEFPILFPVINTNNIFKNKFEFYKYDFNNIIENKKAILSYNNFVISYLNTYFFDGAFPLISENEELPLHIYLDSFLFSYFRNYTNICNFDTIIDEKKLILTYGNCLNSKINYNTVHKIGNDNSLLIKLDNNIAFSIRTNDIIYYKNLNDSSRIFENEKLVLDYKKTVFKQKFESKSFEFNLTYL